MPSIRPLHLLLALLAGALLPLVTIGAANAAAPSVRLNGFVYSTCDQGSPYMTLEFMGVQDQGLSVRMELTAGDRIYFQEQLPVNLPDRGTQHYHAYARWYDETPLEKHGAWPLPEQTNLRIDLSLVDNAGTVLSEWTSVVDSCESGVLIYNGPAASDRDHDLVTATFDKCPELAAPRTVDGCPVIARKASLSIVTSPRRKLVGRLTGAALTAGRTVHLFFAGRGSDRRIATVTTRADGSFVLGYPMVKGEVYVVSPQVVDGTVGRAPRVESRSVILR